MRIFKSVFALTSTRIPVLTQSKSGRRNLLTFVAHILFEVQ